MKGLPADEYLSGNVREKLAIAKRNTELSPEDYGENVRALETVQPVDLTASEISVRLGATWLPPEIVEQFIPAYTVFGGNPAKFIKERFDEELKVLLLHYQWWNLEPKQLTEILPLLCDPDLIKLKCFLKEQLKGRSEK